MEPPARATLVMPAEGDFQRVALGDDGTGDDGDDEEGDGVKKHGAQRAAARGGGRLGGPSAQPPAWPKSSPSAGADAPFALRDARGGAPRAPRTQCLRPEFQSDSTTGTVAGAKRRDATARARPSHVASLCCTLSPPVLNGVEQEAASGIACMNTRSRRAGPSVNRRAARSDERELVARGSARDTRGGELGPDPRVIVASSFASALPPARTHCIAHADFQRRRCLRRRRPRPLCALCCRACPSHGRLPAARGMAYAWQGMAWLAGWRAGVQGHRARRRACCTLHGILVPPPRRVRARLLLRRTLPRSST